MHTYDFIVVGAGASGCVLANRLSENPSLSVLLIEVGGADSSFKIQMPRAFGMALADPKLVHVYPAARPGRDDPDYWIRGKTLGGSTSVNGLLYARGFRRDYDEWAADGCAGWGWRDMAACFRAIEGNDLGPAEWRGDRGPFKVSGGSVASPLNEAVIEAATELGIPRREDLNEMDDVGFGYNSRSVWRGRRMTAARAFLHPIRSRTNLTVLTETEVERVVFEGRRATGVMLRDKSGLREARALREVVLCAGALISPKLLMLSGIGPPDQLKAAGLDVLVDAPQVGQNMREHLLLTLQFRVRKGSANREFSGPRLFLNVLRYQFGRRGPLTFGASEFGGFIKVRAASNRPDAQLMGSPLTVDKSRPGINLEREHGLACGGYALRPESRGELRLRSADPGDPPLLMPNYLGEPTDREIAVGLVRFIRKLAGQPALQPYCAQETFPGADCSSDEQIIDAFNRFGVCSFHTVGTCAMGSSPQSVVDPQLRVRGTEGLRVADISVMPSMVSGNTQAPAMALAWRASQLILGN